MDYGSKSELSRTLLNKISELDLTDWLNDPASICSTRIQKILEKIAAHKHERIILFSCYKSCLDIITQYLGGYNVLVMDSSLDIRGRTEVVAKFSSLPNGILCMTYQLGSCGLNLQAASTVVLTDLLWNRDISKQAIARILRFGQTCQQVNIIMFTSNTAIEKAILLKQKSKLMIYDDLKHGPTNRKVEKINMHEVIKLIQLEENETLYTEVNNLKV